MAPGPNDYHVVADGSLEPGLGKDEPSDEQRAGIRSAGAARLQALKQELEEAGAALTEKEREVMAREQAAIEKERALEAREKAIAKAEAAAKKP